jgi:uncharacterized membrane protein
MKDIFSGVLFIIIGLVFFYKSNFYAMGTHSNIGPGYFPMLISTILILIGLILIIKTFYGANR